MKEREDGIIKNEDLLRNKRDHALFVGYYLIKIPDMLSIVVEHGDGSKCLQLRIYVINLMSDI